MIEVDVYDNVQIVMFVITAHNSPLTVINVKNLLTVVALLRIFIYSTTGFDYLQHLVLTFNDFSLVVLCATAIFIYPSVFSNFYFLYG